MIFQVMEECKIEYPYEPNLSFLYGVIFTGRASGSKNHSRNVTVFEGGEISILLPSENVPKTHCPKLWVGIIRH